MKYAAWGGLVNVMNLASWKYKAIKLPHCLPQAQTVRLEGVGGRGVSGCEKGAINWGKEGGLAERIELFRRATGEGSVPTVIELKHQLVTRPPHPEVESGQ